MKVFCTAAKKKKKLHEEKLNLSKVAVKKTYLGKLYCPFQNATKNVCFLLKPGNWHAQF